MLLVLDLIEVVLWNQDLAGFAPIGWANQSLMLHHVQQSGSSSVPDPQAPLKQGG